MKRLVVLIAGGVAASAAALEWLPWPFVFVLAVWAGVCLRILWTSAATATRMVCLNLAVILVTLGAFEIWAQAGARQGLNRTYSPATYYRNDKDLGYSPTPGTVGHVRTVLGGAEVYDVTYTIGPDGLRVSPPHLTPPEACIVFFGDSFTFGEGLQDTETLPYRVGALGEGRFEVYNFGFHGYGPHQMLSALEHGRVAPVLKCRPTHVIYTAIPDHVARVVALNSWGGHGPRYRLESDGSVRYAGHFDDRRSPSRWRRYVTPQLGKSALYTWITDRYRLTTDADLRLFVAIVAQARRLVQTAYPGCVFEVLLWDQERSEGVGSGSEPQRKSADVDSALRTAGFTPQIAEDILSQYLEDSARFFIPGDGHPSALADDRLARHVVHSVLGESP